MGLLKEFRQFAMRGNVVDLAVGIVIGAAFGKIVSSLVSDVMMPPIGYLIGGKMFADIKIHLGGEAALNLGTFLEAVFDFIIIAFSVFLLVKGINKLKKKEETAPASPPAPSPEEKLLTEIRDILKERNS